MVLVVVFWFVIICWLWWYMVYLLGVVLGVCLGWCFGDCVVSLLLFPG